MSLAYARRLAVSQSPVLPPAKRRCVAALAPALSYHDQGIVDLSPADDPLKQRALHIIEERRSRSYGSLLPERIEVRFLPPHMMQFPEKSWFRTADQPIRTRDGLPERDTRFDKVLKGALSLVRRHKVVQAPRVRLQEDGPRLGNLSSRQSYRYPTSYPEGREGEGKPTLGMTILLNRGLQSEYDLRSALERELCIVAEMHCLGTNWLSPVFRLLARRAMLHDPTILVAAEQPVIGESARLQCIEVRCGHSLPLDGSHEFAQCPRCQSRLVPLAEGSASLPEVIQARYGGLSSRIAIPIGYALIQVLRAVVWPAKPIWSSPTAGDIALRTVVFLAVVLIGLSMLLYWLTPRGKDTFLGNTDRIRSQADRRSQATARANMQEELRQLKIKEGVFAQPNDKVQG